VVLAAGPDSFELDAVLGRGAFGEVYKVTYKRTGMVFAMKVLQSDHIIGKNLVRYAMAERNLLSWVRHPFIVNLYYAFQTASHLVLVLHYCPNGNLSELLKREGRLTETLARLYTAEVFLALEFLHERSVVYRDLKPENVVLDEQRHAMLTDFGLSKEGVEGPRGTASFCGSPAYLAPEVVRRAGHGPAVDIYGLGVLLFELLTGKAPFSDKSRTQLLSKIVSAPLAMPNFMPKDARLFIQQTMNRTPAERYGSEGTPRTAALRAHPFFAGLDLEAVLRREVPAQERASFLTPLLSASGWMPPNDASAASIDGARPQNPFEEPLRGAPVSEQAARKLRGWDFASADRAPTWQTSAGQDADMHWAASREPWWQRWRGCRAGCCLQRGAQT
jgi:protein-serine/threonine kinase